MGFANLVEVIDDLDRQLAIRWVRDVLLMHGRVNMNDIFQRRFPMQTNAHPENPLYAFRAYALAKMHQLRAMTRQLLLELFHAAKSLVIRIALPLQYYRFVTQIL